MDILGLILVATGAIMLFVAKLTANKNAPYGENFDDDFVEILNMMARIIRYFAYFLIFAGVMIFIIPRII